MNAVPITASRTTNRARLVTVALGALIVAIGLVPRVTDLRSAYMIDEKLWIDRSQRFTDAVLGGHFDQAFVTGHPGVPTMWIAGLAQRTLPRDAPLADRYARARLALAVADVILLLIVWLLARRLLGEAAAALGAVLLGMDPFLLAHNRVVHLDGLQVLSMIASFLALLVFEKTDDRRFLFVSGALAGFALLTRTLFAAFLLPVTAIVLRRRLRLLLPWSGVAAAIFVLGWPLIWVRPWKAAWLLGWGAARGANAESDTGGFFLGALRNPGPLFYPVAFAFRASMLTLPLSIPAAVWAFKTKRRDVLRLLGFALGFAAVMTVAAKKADRYVLPSLAAVDVAVAIALVAWVKRAHIAAGIGALIVAAALHGAPALALHPWELAWFNWSAGGPQAAARAIPIGRGEGLETAARALNKLAPGKAVATTRLTQFAEFYNGRAIPIDRSDVAIPGGEHADYILFYISSVQVRRDPAIFERYRNQKPFYELEINGLPYVRVWQV